MCSANKHSRIATRIVIFPKQIHTPNARAHSYNVVQKWEYIFSAVVSHRTQNGSTNLTREDYKYQNKRIKSFNDWESRMNGMWMVSI